MPSSTVDHKDDFNAALERNKELILNRLDEVKNFLTTACKKKQPSLFKQIKLTTITGPQTARLRESLKRGEDFSYHDNSVEGVPILDIYITIDTGYWFDVRKQLKD